MEPAHMSRQIKKKTARPPGGLLWTLLVRGGGVPLQVDEVRSRVQRYAERSTLHELQTKLFWVFLHLGSCTRRTFRKRPISHHPPPSKLAGGWMGGTPYPAFGVFNIYVYDIMKTIPKAGNGVTR